MRKLWLVAGLSLIVCAVMAPTGEAANVVVGTKEAPVGSAPNGAGGDTLFNTAVTDPGATLTSPVSGEVVSWHVEDFKGGPFRLRVMTPLGSGTYVMGGTGPWVTPAGAGAQTFPVALPIKAGQMIAFDSTNATDEVGYRPGGTYGVFLASPVDGAPATEMPQPGDQFTYYAEVQPAPTITALGVTTGPTGGGTGVLIAGTDLEGATAVRFGSDPAASFTVDSEGQITATSPAGSGSVPVSVTTVAGTATSGQQFTYQAPQTSTPTPAPAPISTPAKICTVPRLKGKSLKSARTAIIRADCTVGRVIKKKGVKGANTKVVGQSSKPGTVLPARTAVNVTLGKG